MDLKKIVKIYFIFIMTITSMAALTFNEGVKGYLVSVLHVSEAKDDYNLGINNDIFEKFLAGTGGARKFHSNKNLMPVNVKITQDPFNRFAVPGDSEAEIMQINVKSGGNNFELSDLRLKIHGVSSDMIENAYLLYEEVGESDGKNDAESVERIFEAHMNGDYLEFKNVKFETTGDRNFKILLKVSNELKTGKRIRLDIEEPSDIHMTVNGEQYEIADYYPIKGEYLTISRPRIKKID